jgi:hypothetical protein
MTLPRIARLFLCLTVSLAVRPAHAQVETVLYNFKGGSDGATPLSGLSFDSAGNLYGTTQSGGLGYGTVFKLAPNGNGGWNETVLYSFTGGQGGANPDSAVIIDGAKNLYGTTYQGGANEYGIAWELSPAGASWKETVLYSFPKNDCEYAGTMCTAGLIMDSKGNLYGTTPSDVFELSPFGSGGWTEQVIFSGAAGPLVLSGEDILLFGPFDGGVPPGDYGCGSLTELSPTSNGGWNYAVTSIVGTESRPCGLVGPWLGGFAECGNGICELTAGNQYYITSFWDGVGPPGIIASWVTTGGEGFIGATRTNGIYGDGTVFEMSSQRPPAEKVLWHFDGTDGANPNGGLIQDSAGNIYGTTQSGGSSGNGVVYEVSFPSVKTTTSLASSPNPSTYGQPAFFTATVTSSLGAPPNGETVTFVEGTIVLGAGTLSAGSASFTTSDLPVGTTAVRAVYGGDANLVGSKSKVLTQVVETQGIDGVVSPTSVNFGKVTVGQTSPQQLVSLTNTGNSELSVSAVSITGNFAISKNQCTNGVKPGTHCNVYVTYTPHVAETDTGTLTFTDNATNSPQTVSLTGTGVN